jgi:hypothetical protein
MAETILVKIKGDEKDFVRATGRAGQAQKKFGGGMKALKIGLVAAAAAMTAMIVITKKLMKTFTEHALKIDKINKVTGIACEDLQRWGYVAEQEHGNFETLTKSFTILAQRVVDADQGLETYTREFRAMGVALRDEQGNLRDVNDIFMDMGDYAKNATNQTEAMGHMGKILGSRYVKDLLPMLKLSREEVERLGDEAERLGIVLDTKTIRAAKAFDDKMTKLKNRMKGVGLAIAEKLIPAFDRILDAFEESSGGLDGFVDSIATLASTMAGFLAGNAKGFLRFLSDIIWAFNQAAKGAQAFMDIISWMGGKGGQAVRLGGEAMESYARAVKKTTDISLSSWRAENLALIAEKEQWLEEHPNAKKRAIELEIKSINIAKQRNDLIREEIKARATLADRKDIDTDIDTDTGIGVGVGAGGLSKAQQLAMATTLENWEKQQEAIEAQAEAWKDVGTGMGDVAFATYALGIATEDTTQKIIEGWGEFEGIIMDVAGVISGTFDGLWDTIFDPMLAKMNIAETAWGKFGASIVEDLANMLKQIASKVLIGGLTLAAIVTLLNLIPPTFSIGTAIMALLTGMTKTEAGAAIEKGGGGFKGTVKGLLGMQEGGYVSGKRPYVVGERGPELFVPQAPGEIISNEALNRLAMAMKPGEAPADALGTHNTFVIEGDVNNKLHLGLVYLSTARSYRSQFNEDD